MEHAYVEQLSNYRFAAIFNSRWVSGNSKARAVQGIFQEGQPYPLQIIYPSLRSEPRDFWIEGVCPSEVYDLGRRKGRHRLPVLGFLFDSTSQTRPKRIFGHRTTCREIIAVNEDVDWMNSRINPTPGMPSMESCQRCGNMLSYNVRTLTTSFKIVTIMSISLQVSF
jgi:hypothetical protein